MVIHCGRYGLLAWPMWLVRGRCGLWPMVQIHTAVYNDLNFQWLWTTPITQILRSCHYFSETVQGTFRVSSSDLAKYSVTRTIVWSLSQLIFLFYSPCIRRPHPRRNIAITFGVIKQEVKVIWHKAPHGGPIPRLGVTPGGRKLYHWIPGVGFPISVPQ